MSRIKYAVFGGDGEILEFLQDEGECLEISFAEEYSGLLSIDGAVSEVKRGRCSFDMKKIAQGEYSPVLLTDGRAVTLPKISKNGKKTSPSPCTDEYIREISLRERALSAKLDGLEGELKALLAKINTSTIF